MSEARRATIISSTTATFLFAIKLIIGIMSGSVAVLASAIDSVLDIGVSVFNFFAIKTAEKPPSENFNYGKGKIEALAAVVEGVIITLSGFYILYEGVGKLINQEKTAYLGVSLGVMIISVVITFFLVLYLRKVAKKTDNLVIHSDALHYQTDLLSGGGVVLALALVYFTGYEEIDAIVAIIVAFYIIYSAFGLIKQGVFILLDASIPTDLTDRIKAIIQAESEITSFHILRTRTAADIIFMEVHLVFNPKISLVKAHDASERVEGKVRLLDKTKTWDINVHLDPYDDLSEDKKTLHV